MRGCVMIVLLVLRLVSLINRITTTVELWSLELACLEHHGWLELICQSRQIPCIFNVKIHPRLEQQWRELSNSKHGPQCNF